MVWREDCLCAWFHSSNSARIFRDAVHGGGLVYHIICLCDVLSSLVESDGKSKEKLLQYVMCVLHRSRLVVHAERDDSLMIDRLSMSSFRTDELCLRSPITSSDGVNEPAPIFWGLVPELFTKWSYKEPARQFCTGPSQSF